MRSTRTQLSLLLGIAFVCLAGSRAAEAQLPSNPSVAPLAVIREGPTGRPNEIIVRYASNALPAARAAARASVGGSVLRSIDKSLSVVT